VQRLDRGDDARTGRQRLGAVELGMKFQSDASGFITAYGFINTRRIPARTSAVSGPPAAPTSAR